MFDVFAGERVSNNAFLSPRWGGMLVYNLESPNNETLPAHRALDMRVIMETFVSQLRLLLGITPGVSVYQSCGMHMLVIASVTFQVSPGA